MGIPNRKEIEGHERRFMPKKVIVPRSEYEENLRENGDHRLAEEKRNV